MKNKKMENRMFKILRSIEFLPNKEKINSILGKIHDIRTNIALSVETELVDSTAEFEVNELSNKEIRILMEVLTVHLGTFAIFRERISSCDMDHENFNKMEKRIFVTLAITDEDFGR